MYIITIREPSALWVKRLVRGLATALVRSRTDSKKGNCLFLSKNIYLLININLSPSNLSPSDIIHLCQRFFQSSKLLSAVSCSVVIVNCIFSAHNIMVTWTVLALWDSGATTIGRMVSAKAFGANVRFCECCFSV